MGYKKDRLKGRLNICIVIDVGADKPEEIAVRVSETISCSKRMLKRLSTL